MKNPTQARVAVQCRSGDLPAGDFLFSGPELRANIADPASRLSPVFDNLGDLFVWIANHGWKSVGGSARVWHKPDAP